MGIVLPPELHGVLELAGLPFPNIDEDEVRLDADAARVVQAHAAQSGAEADAAVVGSAAVYQGGSATELQSLWQETGNSSGHLAQAAAATRMAPVALDGMATVVTATKIAVGTVAAVGTVRLAMALLSGGPFAGFTATASLLATRKAGMKIYREAAEGTGRVLAPGLARRVTDPMRRILDNLRRPGGPGGTALAGAGPGRMPLRPQGNLFDSSPGILQRGGGRKGGRGRSDSEANLSPEEQAAVNAKDSGQPYDRSIFNRAKAKERQAEKFSGDRNKQKRGRKK
ncbi:hypothetical protein [Nonomuraea sp. SBT364]|uniref:hypothetical protein n=1 Tax=Nonomuraea sp. SBT364 TaxID=1580530 RepID=UPI00066EB48C|nr:hypothetical protein [Nonomuraea sp. SBT364]